MKKVMKRLTGIVLTLSMLCSLDLFGGGIAPQNKAKAATTGAWELTSKQVWIRSHYLSASESAEIASKNGGSIDNSVFTNAITTNGESEVSTGRTVRDDGAYELTVSYLGEVNGNIRFLESGGYIGGNAEDWCTSDVYTECSIPDSSIAPGESFKLKLHGWMENYRGDWNGACGYVSRAYLNDVTKLYDTDGEYYFVIEASDFSKYDNDFSTTVSGTMPTATKDGETCFISFYSDYAKYAWFYTYNASGSSDDDDADSIGEDTDDEDDIVVGQVKNVKLTNKKVKRIYISYSAVSGAKGYEIQYATNKKLSGAKKLTSTTTKGYFKKKGKKATFKKGKTYYARVRAYAKDSSGDKVYGKWSAIKSVKIKK